MEIMLREVLWSINNRLEEVVKGLRELKPATPSEAQPLVIKTVLGKDGWRHPVTQKSPVLPDEEVGRMVACKHPHGGATILHKMAQAPGMKLHELHGTVDGDLMVVEWDQDPHNIYEIRLTPKPRQ